MKVVYDNEKPKRNIVDYLKSIKVTSTNKHEEIKYNKYLASVVMITIESTTNNKSNEEYEVFVLFQNIDNQEIVGKEFVASFKDNNSANNYYNEIKNKVESLTDKDIEKLIL
jgi:hypothetical protein